MGIYVRELNKKQRIKFGFDEKNYKVTRYLYTGKDAYNNRVEYLKRRGLLFLVDRVPQDMHLYIEYEVEAIVGYE